MRISPKRYVGIGIAVAAMGMYVPSFILLYPFAGPSTLALAFIPPALAGWLLGAWGGLLTGILSFPLTAFLLHRAGDAAAGNLSAGLLGGSTVALIGLAIGWIRGLLDRSKDQKEELRRERALLREEVKMRMEAEERLAHEAFHDPLTDLPNRRLFINRLEQAVARSQRNPDSPYALLYLDLNGFKLINDSLGHQAGDQSLIQVADRLRSPLRAVDTVARIGGDEFAVLLEGVSTPDEVIAIVQRIQEKLSSPIQWNGNSIAIGASIGVVMNLTVYEQIDDILRDADIAMYRAKSSGHNRFQVFGDWVNEGREEQMTGPNMG